MDRLIAPNSVDADHADTAPATGTPGFATDGNPAAGVPATFWPSYQYNAFQEELIALIVEGGLTPDNATNTQVRDAALALFAKISGDATKTFSVAPATAPQHAVQLGQISGKNRIINPRFQINDRLYASGTVVTSGTYLVDRWKASSANTSLTFTAAPQGQPVTIVGSLQQIVEQANVAAGTYTLSWTGTAQGRVYDSGGSTPSYASSPVTLSLDGLANVVVEFNAGTLDKVQMESGAAATQLEYRAIGQELLLCQRYYERQFVANTTVFCIGQAVSGSTAYGFVKFSVRKRAAPSVSYTGTAVVWTAGATSGGGTVTMTSPNLDGTAIQANGASGLSAGNAASFVAVSGALSISADADF